LTGGGLMLLALLRNSITTKKLANDKHSLFYSCKEHE
jgi:hypothetical protein